MTVSVSAKEFEIFLNAIQNIDNQGSTFKIHKNYIDVITMTPDNSSIILYSKINILNPDDINDDELEDYENEEHLKNIHIKDIKKFIRLLNMNAGSDTFTFKVEENYVYFENQKVSGAKFMLGEFPFRKPLRGVTPEWFNSFKKNVRINLKKEQIKDIIAAASFVSENVQKIYFYQQGDDIIAEVNDRLKDNVDNISFNLGKVEEGNLQANSVINSLSLPKIYLSSPDILLETSTVEKGGRPASEILFLSVVSENVLIKYLLNSKPE